MQPVNSISLQREPMDQESLILLDGQSTGALVDGAHLIAAFRCDSGWLLLTTDNTWDESPLNITLYDGDFRERDSVAILMQNQPEPIRYQFLACESPDTVRFVYLHEWQLQVHRRLRPNLPGLTEPWGVLRRNPFVRRFSVSRLRKLA